MPITRLGRINEQVKTRKVNAKLVIRLRRQALKRFDTEAQDADHNV
jgi:hypothetical protein